MDELLSYNQKHAFEHEPAKPTGPGPSTKTFAVTVPHKPRLRAHSTTGPAPTPTPTPRFLYNLHKDVIFRIELLSEEWVRRLLVVIYWAMTVGFVTLVLLAVLKGVGHLDDVGSGSAYFRANMVIGSMTSVAMGVSTGCLLFRVYDVTRRGFRWSLRRRRQVILEAVTLVSHTVNSLSYFLANYLALHGEGISLARWFEWLAIIRETMWNNIFLAFVLKSRLLNLWLDDKGVPIGRADALLMDAPWSKHWFLFLVWLAYESVFVAYVVVSYVNPSKVYTNAPSLNSALCSVPEVILLLSGILSVVLVFYQLLGLWYVRKAYKQLLERPYNMFRSTNIELRYHFMCFGTVGDFISFSLVLLFWVRYDSCGTAILGMFGTLPSQVLMTVLSVVTCIFVMPIKPGRTVTFVDQAPPLVWREAEMDLRKGGRVKLNNTCLQDNLKNQENGDSVVLETEPKKSVDKPPPFCFELALKLWYWSLAVYGYDHGSKRCFDPKYPHLCFETAMLLYGLEEHEHFQDESCDTHVMMGWNKNTILLCFRGTYSASNVWTDLQFWRVVHPPRRGSFFLRTQPLVHWGFMKSWGSSKLNYRILNQVIKVMTSPDFDSSSARVLVTGHSLGGALAVLASYDIARYCGLSRDRIVCYTYGAPRVGNHAFAREFNSLVPNTWQVINDEDLVPRMPKFLVLFKHVGSKVIITPSGDLIVKPHFVEVSLYKMFMLFKKSSSVTQHLMLSYRKSFVAICEAQFMDGKRLPGGLEAMLALLDGSDQVLSTSLGLEMGNLKDKLPVERDIWTSSSEEKTSKQQDCLRGIWLDLSNKENQWWENGGEQEEDESGTGSSLKEETSSRKSDSDGSSKILETQYPCSHTPC